MFLVHSVLESLNSKKIVTQIHVQCGLNGRSGHSAPRVAVAVDVKGAENVQHRHSGMDGTFVKEEMTLKKKLVMKM